ncbi:MAG: hypothetical protein Q3996_02465, partial [Candidatus Saccharibacteria bacterium]|nr:hypothetical protein [Candidatus Saccharibacteria bacterium]
SVKKRFAKRKRSLNAELTMNNPALLNKVNISIGVIKIIVMFLSWLVKCYLGYNDLKLDFLILVL